MRCVAGPGLTLPPCLHSFDYNLYTVKVSIEDGENVVSSRIMNETQAVAPVFFVPVTPSTIQSPSLNRWRSLQMSCGFNAFKCACVIPANTTLPSPACYAPGGDLNHWTAETREGCIRFLQLWTLRNSPKISGIISRTPKMNPRAQVVINRRDLGGS
jgi:hypothetical protein